MHQLIPFLFMIVYIMIWLLLCAAEKKTRVSGWPKFEIYKTCDKGEWSILALDFDNKFAHV